MASYHHALVLAGRYSRKPTHNCVCSVVVNAPPHHATLVRCLALTPASRRCRRSRACTPPPVVQLVAFGTQVTELVAAVEVERLGRVAASDELAERLRAKQVRADAVSAARTTPGAGPLEALPLMLRFFCARITTETSTLPLTTSILPLPLPLLLLLLFSFFFFLFFFSSSSFSPGAAGLQAAEARAEGLARENADLQRAMGELGAKEAARLEELGRMHEELVRARECV